MWDEKTLSFTAQTVLEKVPGHTLSCVFSALKPFMMCDLRIRHMAFHRDAAYRAAKLCVCGGFAA